MTHELKCWPGPFEGVATGRKTFEVRRDDRGFDVGDELWLRCWDPVTREYTGREVTRRVVWVERGWGMPAGMCVMGLVVP